MATLTTAQKRFVVTELATFSDPSEVAEAVQEEFGVDVSRQQVHYYDPTVGQQKPGEKWRELFHETRSAFVNDVSRHAIAHRAYRVKELGDLFEQAKEMKNVPLAMDVLEQAAKEVGEAYTNKKLLDVDPKGFLADLLGVSPDELPDGDA